MTADETETLSRAAQALVDVERQQVGASAAAEQRIFERLVERNAFATASAASSAAAGTTAGQAALSKVLVGVVAGALVGGGVATYHASTELESLRQMLSASQRALVEATADSAEAQRRAEETLAELAAAKAMPSPLPPPPPSPPPRASSPPELKGTLAAEAVLIDQARTALLKGDHEAAARPLATHRLRFPSGHMAEEREVMTIQTLLGQGDRAGARAAAQRFRAQYPQSPLTPTLDALFASEP